MKAELNKKTMYWRFGDSGEYIYKTEAEAIEKGRKELSVKLKKVCNNGNVSRGN